MCRRNLNAAHKLELQFANKDELLAMGKEKREQNLMRGKVKPEMSDTDTSEEPTTREKIAAAAEIKRVCQILTHPLRMKDGTRENASVKY